MRLKPLLLKKIYSYANNNDDNDKKNIKVMMIMIIRGRTTKIIVAR